MNDQTEAFYLFMTPALINKAIWYSRGTAKWHLLWKAPHMYFHLPKLSIFQASYQEVHHHPLMARLQQLAIPFYITVSNVWFLLGHTIIFSNCKFQWMNYKELSQVGISEIFWETHNDHWAQPLALDITTQNSNLMSERGAQVLLELYGALWTIIYKNCPG